MSNKFKDIKIVSNSDKRLVKSVFDTLNTITSNSHHSFVVRKSERLASVIYVITGFISQDDPLRSRLRICALDVITLSANPHELVGSGAERFKARCAEIVTILKTAEYSGLVSEMNAKLIAEEYVSLSAFVWANAMKIAEGRTLDKSSISEPRAVSSRTSHSFKGHVVGNKVSDRTSIGVLKDSSDKRKDSILGIFNNKESISLRDAVSLIQGVSEKTIQRDLLELVSKGVLIKNGSRRWTTYTKAPPGKA